MVILFFMMGKKLERIEKSRCLLLLLLLLLLFCGGVGRVCPKAIQNTLLPCSGNHSQTWTDVYVVRNTSSKSEQQEGWEGGKANLCSLFPLSYTRDCHHWIKWHDGMVGDSDLHCTPPMEFTQSTLDQVLISNHLWQLRIFK